MKRHTTKYYERRIAEQRSRAFGMGFTPQERHVLVLHNVAKNGSTQVRELLLTDEEAVAMLVDGRALRASVTNGERTVHVYIDP